MANNQMRGTLSLASNLGQAPRINTQAGGVADSGAAQAFDGLASGLNRIGAEVGRIADHAAQKEGAEAGRLAGLDPEFRTTRALTIRGEAFDKAGLQVAETRIRTGISNDFSAAVEKHGESPAKLGEVLAAKGEAWLANAPDELKPELKLLMDGQRTAAMRNAARAQTARMVAEQKAALQEGLAESLKGIHQRSYALGLDAEADKIIGAEMAALAKTLTRTGMDGKPLVAPEARRKLLKEAETEVATSRLLGAFSRTGTLEAKAEFLKQFEADFAGSKGLAKVYDLDGFRRVQGALESEFRSARAEGRAATQLLSDSVKDVQKLAEKGFAPPPEQLAALKSRVAASGDPALAASLEDAEHLAHWQSAARRATPAELDRFLLEERSRLGGGADARSVKRLEIGETLADTMRSELKQDALGWADRVGLLKVAPLDLSSADAAAVSLRARIAQAETVGDTYGQPPQYLRPAEKQRLATLAAQGGAQTLIIAQGIAAAGGERAPAILAEIHDHAPAVAMLGGHVASAGVTPAAQDAADGLALLKQKDVKPMAPSAPEARRQAQAAHGGALSALPRAEAAAIDLTNAAYEVRARRRGVTDFDASLWKETFAEVLGERKIGGEVYGGIATPGYYEGVNRPVVVPANVKRDGFHELIEALRLDDLTGTLGAPLDGAGKPLPITAVRRATLVSVGDSKYRLALGDVDTDPQWIATGRGEPYVLDLKALEPKLKKRRRDLYLGGN